MKYIIKHIMLIRILSLIPFVIVGMLIPVTDYFMLSFIGFIYTFGVFQIFLTILENKYKAINQHIFKRNVVIRIVHFVIISIFACTIFALTDMYNNPMIVLPFILLTGLTGGYIDHLDKKNTKILKSL
ncbi:hypothetical protein [Mammaliicoccus sciuri]|uniref:hypothetical protein n=1 Tax=Mammaliicoccus sciuri TaxID=1296 RepID=UPI001FB2F43F|nr:hypothetical protein [Mammaliicoccus sciuri]MCJ1785638.1 hypothetical protein [Mammaliicoccus sciuri]